MDAIDVLQYAARRTRRTERGRCTWFCWVWQRRRNFRPKICQSRNPKDAEIWFCLRADYEFAEARRYAAADDPHRKRIDTKDFQHSRGDTVGRSAAHTVSFPA